MQTITDQTEDDKMRITDVKVVSSYNCVDSEHPTIVVPGLPPKWLAREHDQLLECDDTITRFIDQNAGRWPNSPMEPAIRAVLHLQPAYDFTALNLITHCGNLVQMLRLAVTNNQFSFRAQVVDGTIILYRNDKVSQTTEGQGFGGDLRRKHLEQPNGLKDSVSHHRVVTYRLGDLAIMVRNNAHAYIMSDTLDITLGLNAMDLSTSKKEHFENVVIKSSGTLLPCSAILELCIHKAQQKPLSKSRRVIWLTRPGHFITSSYKIDKEDKKMAAAKASSIKYQNAEDLSSAFEAENQDEIKKFYDIMWDLVQRLRSAANNGEGNTFLIERKNGSEEVTITGSDEISGLSEELCERLKAKP